MIILDGKLYEVPGVTTISWFDDPKRVPRIKKTTPRTRTIRMIFCHTVKGIHCKRLRPGGKNSDAVFAYLREQATSNREASWDATVAADGHVYWQNDPVTGFSWHAMQVNPYSIGLEMMQDADGSMYEATIAATAKLVAFLCEQLGVQKQTPWEPSSDQPHAWRIERFDPGQAGADCVGVFGHRNVWVHRSKADHTLVSAKGFGDPNDFVFERLVSEQHFERLVFHGKDPQDLRVWKGRQKALGFDGEDVDGIPLTKTLTRLRGRGYVNGIWVDSPAQS
jgi:hypothetical protein